MLDGITQGIPNVDWEPSEVSAVKMYLVPECILISSSQVGRDDLQLNFLADCERAGWPGITLYGRSLANSDGKLGHSNSGVRGRINDSSGTSVVPLIVIHISTLWTIDAGVDPSNTQLRLPPTATRESHCH